MKFLDNYRFKYKIILVALLLILFGYFCTFLSFSFNSDEEVTMGLIQHTYKGIIMINSLDVHPPLYYLLLKLFLNIFTFWTTSVFIKIIFSRIFSIILFIITFYFLNKVLNISGVKLRGTVLFIFYCFMPSILAVATHVRMYELGTLFIVIEYYLLIRFMDSNNSKYLYVATVFAVLSIYTQYYIGLISIILLFVYFIKGLLLKKFNIWLEYIFSMIIFIVLCLPVFPYVFRQFINRSSYPIANAGVFNQTVSSLVQLTASGSKIKEIFDILLAVILIILTISLLKIINIKPLEYRFLEILSCIVISLFVEIIISVIYRPFFECRCIFPLIAIYYFLFVGLILIYVGNNINRIIKNKIIISLFVILSIFLIFININKLSQNIKIYDYSSVKLIDSFNNWKLNRNKVVDVNTDKYPYTSNEAWYATQSSVYLKSINKYALVSDAKSTNLYKECNGNKQFVHKVFPNLKTN